MVWVPTEEQPVGVGVSFADVATGLQQVPTSGVSQANHHEEAVPRSDTEQNSNGQTAPVLPGNKMVLRIPSSPSKPDKQPRHRSSWPETPQPRRSTRCV